MLRNLKADMEKAVTDLNYEHAHRLKRKFELLENYQSKSTVVNSSITDVDVFSIASEEKYAFVNYLKVMNGTIIQTQTIELKKRLDESDEELLTLAISEFRSRYDSHSKEIIVPFDIDLEDTVHKIYGAQTGRKKKAA